MDSTPNGVKRGTSFPWVVSEICQEDGCGEESAHRKRSALQRPAKPPATWTAGDVGHGDEGIKENPLSPIEPGRDGPSGRTNAGGTAKEGMTRRQREMIIRTTRVSGRRVLCRRGSQRYPSLRSGKAGPCPLPDGSLAHGHPSATSYVRGDRQAHKDTLGCQPRGDGSHVPESPEIFHDQSTLPGVNMSARDLDPPSRRGQEVARAKRPHAMCEPLPGTDRAADGVSGGWGREARPGSSGRPLKSEHGAIAYAPVQSV